MGIVVQTKSNAYRFKNRHTIYLCENANTFKEIDGDVETGDGDVSGGYGF